MIDFHQCFTLGNITVDPNADTLSCHGETIEIQSMAMKVLCYFARHQAQLITRDELRDHVWNNTTTSNHTINNHIYSLRRTIAQLEPNTKYIHTVTGGIDNGYRLLATVTQAATHAPINSNDKVASADADIAVKTACAPQGKRTQTNGLGVTKTTKVIAILMLVIGIISYWQWATTPQYSRSSPISFLPGRAQSPAVSSDGKFIIYAHKDNRNNTTKTWELYASYLASPKKVVKVFDTPHNHDNFVSISPNNKYITFVRYNKGAEGIYIADFNSKTLTATNAKLIIKLSAMNLSPAISWLNDSQFYYSAQDVFNAPLRIYLYDLALDSSEQITSPAINTFGDIAAVVSPNKKWLAIMRADGENGYQLKLLDLQNNDIADTPVNISENRLNISFSDHSDLIYFIDEQGYVASYQINGKQIKRVSQQQYLGYWPLKIPGKAQMILQQDWGLSSLTTQIMRFNNPLTGGNGLSEVVVNNGLSIRAIEGIDNGLIFAAIKPNHHVELWRYQNGQAQQLTEFNEKAKYRYPLSINWLKNSAQALLSLNKSCRLLNVTTGKDTPLCPAGEHVYAGRFSFDGQSILLPAIKNNHSMAIKMAVSGFPLEPLIPLKNANLIVQTSPDDYYYSEQPSFDIYHYDASTEQHSKIIDRTYVNNPYSINDFVVTIDGIYFMDRVKVTENAIYFYDFTDKSIQYVIPSKDNYPNLVVSEDQQFIYLIQSIDNDSKLLLIE